MPADALFWITLVILVGIYAVWWDEERDARSKERKHPTVKPLGRPSDSG